MNWQSSNSVVIRHGSASVNITAGWETSSHICLLFFLFRILFFPVSLFYYFHFPLWWSCSSSHSAYIRQKEDTHLQWLDTFHISRALFLTAGDHPVCLILLFTDYMSPLAKSNSVGILYVSILPTLPPSFLTLLVSPRQPGGQIGARLS